MANNSFKNLQNKLQKLKKYDEPKRRKDALVYIQELTKLVHSSYITESTSDYMFLKTLHDAVKESKYFGGFTKQVREMLFIIEKRYNYTYEEDKTDIE
tara:strand:- start:20 stop:313 length:294 start_codon:yes stop_codon:yes gene_type:complete